MKTRFRLTVPLVCLATLAWADVKLPAVFGSHMVLQREKPVPVWGWADPGERVTVRFNGQTKTTKAAKDGRWNVALDPLAAGGPYQLTVQGKTSSQTLDDVLVGEVWVCSGQSNMEWPLSAARDAKDEIRQANYPTIRQFLVKKDISLSPKDDVAGQWAVCSPQTAAQFTAVGYFFARDLVKNLNVPIGLVNTSWGGTHSETWTSRDALVADGEFRDVAAHIPNSLDELERSGMARTKALVDAQGGYPSAIDLANWSQPGFDASGWKTLKQPSDWEWQGLPTFDGVVWLRKVVNLPADVNLGNATLSLGQIDDADSTYVNGQFIGSTNAYNVARQYALPNGLLRTGPNVIAVRIKDTGGGGGMMGAADQMHLDAGTLTVPLEGAWQYRVETAFPTSYRPGPNSYATLLYNAMLRPLMPYAMRGVIWYQGESNAGRAYQYRKAFPMMIQDWRQQWAKAAGRATVEEFPFLFVQLASFNAGGGNSQKGSGWAELREAQAATLRLPNTGMAVTADIGEANDIHPRNKQDVGKRLAAEARRVAYGQNVVSAGPVFAAMQPEGGKVRLTYQNVGGGLMTPDKYGYLRGFEVAGADQKFVPAKAEIRGDSVVIWNDSVAAPVAVRYGWADDNGEVNLYNREGFPAAPFRTDTWPGVTEKTKFDN